MNCKLRILLFLTSILVLSACTQEYKKENKPDNIYMLLQDVLKERKENLVNYMNESLQLAKKIQNDENMISFFKTKRDYYHLKKNGPVPENLDIQIEKLKENINHYYIVNYQSFYDILFIDTQGEIFYTIKKQADYHQNIFKNELSETRLSKKLKDFPNESFVDFQFYEISGEPSAFFIEPVKEKGKTIGWFVLQLSVNEINSLFSINENLGKTGEVLLVNTNHYLLTDSRFAIEPTILKQQLPEENISSKFKERNGRKVVTDYRGKKAYSVFEVFNFFGSEWLIIAKIDENEVLTNEYRKNEKMYYPLILNKVRQNKIKSSEPVSVKKEQEIVDMNEYRRVDTGAVLFTKGVSTCTAVAICYPGKFTYMAHISPYDAIYNKNGTDLLAQMFKQIDYFDITESERHKLHIYIASAQTGSLKKLIEKMIDNGYFLSQIKFAFNPGASYANVYSDCLTNAVWVDWKMKKNDGSDYLLHQNFTHIPSIETLLIEAKTTQ
jgi:hypothetical protein